MTKFSYSLMLILLLGSAYHVATAEIPTSAHLPDNPSQQTIDFPISLRADHVEYDEKMDMFHARGNVEVIQYLNPHSTQGFERSHTKPSKLKKQNAGKEAQGRSDADKAPEEPTLKQAQKKPLFFDLHTKTYTQTRTSEDGRLLDPTQRRYVRADHIQFDRKRGVITADGHVMVVDEQDHVLWGDFIELTQSFDTMLAQSIRVLFGQEEGRLRAQSAERKHGKKNVFYNVMYSPCDVCQTSQNPLWTIRAQKVMHNEDDQTMRYQNATLNLFGVPVAYTPYFEHPDPSVKRKTGVLAPLYGHSSDLGTYMRVPYFIVLDERQDMTVSPMITSKQGPAISVEYRRFERRGDFQIDGSITQTRKLRRNDLRLERSHNGALVTSVPPKDRYHIVSRGRFELTDKDLLTAEINRASDTTYLRRYNVINSQQKLAHNKNLTSFGSYEHFEDKSYVGAKAYSFQTDDRKHTPYVFPMVRLLKTTPPGRRGEYISVEGNVLHLRRPDSILNVAPRAKTRMMANVHGHLPFAFESGHVVELDARLRGDTYHIKHYQTTLSPLKSHYNTGRMMPSFSATWRYPLSRMTAYGQHTLEPMVQYVGTVKKLNSLKIPNEDSRLSELDDQNLFLFRRTSGLDRIEDGQRLVYGCGSGLYGSQGRRAHIFLGQSYQLVKRPAYVFGAGQPFQTIPAMNSTQASDYITRVQLVPHAYVRLYYRGRFDGRKGNHRFSEISSNLGGDKLSMNTSYVYVHRLETPLQQPIQQVNVQLFARITERWRTAVAHSHNLSKFEGHARAVSVLAVFENDCFNMSMGVYRSQYRDRDLAPDHGVLVQLSFKNLGNFSPLGSSSMPQPSIRSIPRSF